MEPYVIFNSISVSIIICGIIYYIINELPSCITGSGIIEPFNTPTYIVHTPPNKTLDNKCARKSPKIPSMALLELKYVEELSNFFR